MSEQNSLKIGVLGCGRIVTRRVLPASTESQITKIISIASQREGIAQQVAAEFQIPNAYGSYEELLNSSEIEAVYIPCTGDQHHKWTLAAADAGKHVLCEKPLAPTFQEAKEMVAACESNGVLLQEAFMWRQHPLAQRMKQEVIEGKIGKLRLITVNFSFQLDRNDWRLRPEKGGGAMWDLGCYGVNACRFFTDEEPTAISADAHWWESGVDMTMRIGLTFPGQVLANIDCSFDAPFRCRMELVGDNGRILVDPAFQPAERPVFQLWSSAERDTPVESIETSTRNQYACQLDTFARGVREGRLVDFAENGLKNMRVMEDILNVAKQARKE